MKYYDIKCHNISYFNVSFCFQSLWPANVSKKNFSSEENREDHKRVESGAFSRQMSTAAHQGRLTEI